MVCAKHVSVLNEYWNTHYRHHCLSPPPVPIIDSVEAAVLSLFEVEVNISLLTNGGQSVTEYIVSWFTCVLSRPWLVGKACGLWKLD